MTASYDPIVASLVNAIQTELQQHPVKDVADQARKAIRLLERALQTATGSSQLNLPNLGTNRLPFHGLRIRGGNPTRKLLANEKQQAVVIDAKGKLVVVSAELVPSRAAIATRPVDDDQLLAEDLIGMVRAVRSILRNNMDLRGRVQNVRDLAVKVEQVFGVADRRSGLG